MNDETQMIQLGGKPYVILPRAEYDRLRLLAKADALPALPPPDKRGHVPAVEYARASLSRKIVRQRAELGLSQRELASLAGVRVETLCRIETGKVSPSSVTVERIERAFQKATQSKPSK